MSKLAKITRNTHVWLPGWFKARRNQQDLPSPKRVWLTIADHFEPFWNGADEKTAYRRVMPWHKKWPEIAARHHDSAGRPPKYTFFYPQEEYQPDLLSLLAEMSHSQIADVEVHI